MFPDIFAPALKIVENSKKFSMLSLYILWDDWLIFMISGSNKQQQQELQYILLKLNCHRRRICKKCILDVMTL